MHEPRIAITMLHWGSVETTANALGSLAAVAHPRFDVFLVDQTGGFRLALPANVRVIVPETNLGFSGGHNLAFERVLSDGYDYVLMLNNDVTVAPDALDLLVATIETHPRAAAVGPTVVYDDPPDAIWYAGGELRWREGRVRHLQMREPMSALRSHRATEVTFVTGCALMLRVAALAEVGLLDDRCFMYWEDADWCARASACGFELYYEPAAVVTHMVSASLGVSSPDYLYYFLRNKLLFIRLHTPWPWKPLAWCLAVAFIARELTGLLVRPRRDPRPYLRSIAQAVSHHAQRAYGRRRRDRRSLRDAPEEPPR